MIKVEEKSFFENATPDEFYQIPHEIPPHARETDYKNPFYIKDLPASCSLRKTFLRKHCLLPTHCVYHRKIQNTFITTTPIPLLQENKHDQLHKPSKKSGNNVSVPQFSY